MDPRERFTATVEAYAAHRPDYPVALLDWLEAAVGGRTAVDLGAGTGIFTRMLAARGWDVVGVEPNEAMRAAANEAGGARYVAGSAEASGLPDDAAALVIGAQAFHWFRLDAALPEIDRVGTERAVAVWNVRADRGFAAAYERILLDFSTDYASVPKPEPTLAALRARRPGGEDRRFPHGQRLDEAGMLGRAWSSSYVVHGVADRPAFDAALRAAFAEHARDGIVDLDYDTVLYAWPIG